MPGNMVSAGWVVALATIVMVAVQYFARVILVAQISGLLVEALSWPPGIGTTLPGTLRRFAQNGMSPAQPGYKQKFTYKRGAK